MLATGILSFPFALNPQGRRNRETAIARRGHASGRLNSPPVTRRR